MSLCGPSWQCWAAESVTAEPGATTSAPGGSPVEPEATIGEPGGAIAFGEGEDCVLVLEKGTSAPGGVTALGEGGGDRGKSTIAPTTDARGGNTGSDNRRRRSAQDHMCFKRDPSSQRRRRSSRRRSRYLRRDRYAQKGHRTQSGRRGCANRDHCSQKGDGDQGRTAPGWTTVAHGGTTCARGGATSSARGEQQVQEAPRPQQQQRISSSRSGPEGARQQRGWERRERKSPFCAHEKGSLEQTRIGIAGEPAASLTFTRAKKGGLRGFESVQRATPLLR